MKLHLLDDNPSPLYQQVAAAVRRALADGDVVAGDRLPPARALAEALGVNMHTVLRGYAELEADGLVRVRRGRGVVVTAGSVGRARLQELARQLMDEARRVGVGTDEVIQMVSGLG